MSGPFGSSQWMYNAGGDFYPTTIDNSLRFEGKSAPSYLSRTFTAGSNTTWTFSWWFKPDLETNNNGTLPYFFATSGNTYIRQQSGEGYQIEGNLRGSGGTNYFFSYAPMLRDPSAWYHCVIAIDTTQGTSSNRIKFYLNGEQQTNAGGLGLSYPPLNHNTQVNTAVAHRLGAHPSAPSSYAFSGYMAEINFVDGTQLDASSFGETKSGIWIPKAYSGSYGTNGFHLEFDGNANDSSGNGNNWTANNISAHDYMPDSPTNNFNTFSTVIPTNQGTRSEGNLKSSSVAGGSSSYGPMSCYNVHSGKWYFEFRITGGTARDIYAGAFYARLDNTIRFGKDMAIVYAGLIYGGGSIVQSGLANPAINDVFGFAVDVDNSTCQIYRNGSTYGNLVDFSSSSYVSNGFMGMGHYHGNSSTNSTVVVNYGQDSTFAGATTAGGNADDNGIGDFKHTVPSGYLSMCSANLPELAIDPANDDASEDYFNTALYSGNGSTQSITGVGFQPDWVWIKKRNNTSNHSLTDSVRGVTKLLFTNSSNSESTFSGGLSSFDSDGFSLAGGDTGFNASGSTYVAWNWKAGGTAVSNTDGSITSSVSANPTAGFSIVNYVGTGTNDSYGHGLGVAPEMIITKDRTDPANWAVYVASVGTGKYLQLNLNATTITNPVIYPTVTSTTIGVGVQGDGSITNTSGDNYISYCFANVEGHQKAGSYTGNGSTDGTFINCGFRPAFVMIKCTSAVESWNIFDSARDPNNITKLNLNPNVSNAESDAESGNRAIDILSNGFKCRGSNSAINNGSYIYLAFAEQPFKYANAR